VRRWRERQRIDLALKDVLPSVETENMMVADPAFCMAPHLTGPWGQAASLWERSVRRPGLELEFGDQLIQGSKNRFVNEALSEIPIILGSI
jgi:hypothetical protein